MKIYFVTGNKNKLKEVQMIMPEVEGLELDLIEIQELDHKKVLEHKLKEAQKYKPGVNLIVEDLSLVINGTNGLPGPLIKWFLKSVGRKGIYKMAKNFGDQTAVVEEILGYVTREGKMEYFEGIVKGKIVEPRGESDFGFDPIFVPDGTNKTYAEMSIEEKNKISHRRKALNKLKEYLEK
ncbi:MAG: RdgB/HAM1 family non-canonical purine NTP pyrophosphatase [Candidatus Shapirobacteria bacterium]|nr:RdgB/HAM1 family non-canonical purine NTP pyrophosphatase [Candidatus Shapirobacteria bacterium]